MGGQRGESEQLYDAYASALALHSEAPDAKNIAFVSMGTGVYKWPIELAADIAVRALWHFKAPCGAGVWWTRRELFVLRPHPSGAAVAALPRCLTTLWFG